MADLEAREKARQESLQRMASEDSARRARQAQQDMEEERVRQEALKKAEEAKKSGVAEDLRAEAELIEKGAKIFAKFPVSAGWGQEKATEIAQKNTLKLPLTDEEREFMQNFELWVKYKIFQEQQRLKEGLKEPPKEKEETPKPKTEEAPK